jgi:hypothetical protein
MRSEEVPSASVFSERLCRNEGNTMFVILNEVKNLTQSVILNGVKDLRSSFAFAQDKLRLRPQNDITTQSLTGEGMLLRRA